MPVTLAEAKVGMAEKVDQQVIDMFRRSSLLMDKLTFDDAISPGTGGSTLTYGYIQLKTPTQAGVRAINSEYTPVEAKREKKTAAAVPMGQAFEVDRVIQNTSGAIDEIAFQLEQAVKATSNYFHNLVVNGTAASSGAGYVTNTFDGLKKTLTGASTNVTSEVDISSAANIDSNKNAFLDEVDNFLSLLDGKPSVLLMNTKMLTIMRGVARRVGYYEREKNDFGMYVESFGGVPMMDLGGYYNGSATVDVIPTTAASASAFGMTDIYAVTLGLDAFHGISPQGGSMISTYLPDMSAPGAVKKGEVELVAGAVLKNTLKAGVLTGIKIAPKTA